MVPIFSSLGTIIGGAYALYFIRTNFNLKFAFQRKETLIYHLKEAHHIFISNIAVSLYTTSTTFILGIFTNNIILGYYAAADKIIQAFKGLMGPVSQAIYPYVSKKTHQSKEEGLKLDIGALWDLIILQPITNILISLSHYLWGSFGLAIIVLTLVVNGLLYPLTLKQMRATKASQDLQPKLEALKKKHGQDAQALAQEQMKLYSESGLSPAGCLLPMLIQTPIWIALYQAIIRVMAVNPESFVNLSEFLYSWDIVYKALPLNNNFLWLNLAVPDILLAILVGLSMWIQQK